MSQKSAVFVIGPAGNGKTTFCSTILRHAKAQKRSMHLINLDPAADEFQESDPSVDIRELVTLEEIMESEGLGPNGALVACFELLMEHIDWLENEIGDFDEDFLIIDCPGQIELYTHTPMVKDLMNVFQYQWNYRICAVYMMESQFIQDPCKYFSGVLCALSAMVQLEVPHLNVLSKIDLLGDKAEDSEWIEEYLVPQGDDLLEGAQEGMPKYKELNKAIVRLIDEYSMIRFIPLNYKNEDSVGFVMSQLDHILQIDDFKEPKEAELNEDCFE